MDDSIFTDLDEMSLSDLPDLPDSVWLRLMANALDPDAPAVGADLIPVDLPAGDSNEAGDDTAMFNDGWAPDDNPETPVDDASNSDDGSDLLPPHHAEDSSHDDVHSYGFGSHDSGLDSSSGGDSAFGGEPRTDHSGDGLG